MLFCSAGRGSTAFYLLLLASIVIPRGMSNRQKACKVTPFLGKLIKWPPLAPSRPLPSPLLFVSAFPFPTDSLFSRPLRLLIHQINALFYAQSCSVLSPKHIVGLSPPTKLQSTHQFSFFLLSAPRDSCGRADNIPPAACFAEAPGTTLYGAFFPMPFASCHPTSTHGDEDKMTMNNCLSSMVIAFSFIAPAATAADKGALPFLLAHQDMMSLTRLKLRDKTESHELPY
ncbi:hypothetical protein CDD82_615 [Ophiocordyceps australis]|uniref:Secreted protein n=1 Tax=Ophiocordyceps australis TaxID=1399860 RepID=A0A2C5YN62_9HYPO|nr:hypothetical protein CDD82_615 [Ophiocordyceps australis]